MWYYQPVITIGFKFGNMGAIKPKFHFLLIAIEYFNIKTIQLILE